MIDEDVFAEFAMAILILFVLGWYVAGAMK